MRCAAAELGPVMEREEEGVVWWCGTMGRPGSGGCARKKMLEATKFQRRKPDAGLEATTGIDRRSASWNSHFGEGGPEVVINGTYAEGEKSDCGLGLQKQFPMRLKTMPETMSSHSTRWRSEISNFFSRCPRIDILYGTPPPTLAD